MGNERQKVTHNSQIVEMSILLLQCIVFFYILNLVYKIILVHGGLYLVVSSEWSGFEPGLDHCV